MFLLASHSYQCWETMNKTCVELCYGPTTSSSSTAPSIRDPSNFLSVHVIKPKFCKMPFEIIRWEVRTLLLLIGAPDYLSIHSGSVKHVINIHHLSTTICSYDLVVTQLIYYISPSFGKIIKLDYWWFFATIIKISTMK